MFDWLNRLVGAFRSPKIIIIASGEPDDAPVGVFPTRFAETVDRLMNHDGKKEDYSKVTHAISADGLIIPVGQRRKGGSDG